MKKEFITATGKLTIEGDVLKVKHFKENYRSRPSLWFTWLLLLLMANINVTKTKPLATVIVAFAGLLLLGYFINFVYRNQWKNKFRLRNVKGIKTIPDESGLETRVVLYFRSNTSKEIDFRTSENQHEAFGQYIEQYLTHTQFA